MALNLDQAILLGHLTSGYYVSTYPVNYTPLAIGPNQCAFLCLSICPLLAMAAEAGSVITQSGSLKSIDPGAIICVNPLSVHPSHDSVE